MREQTELSDIAVEQIETANAEIALENEVESLRTKLAYMAADFDNYKKRCQREKEEIISSASKKIAEDIFPIIDNFQIAQATLSTADFNSHSSVTAGINMVMNDLTNALKKHGFDKIEVKVGDTFDVNTSEALISEESNLEHGLVTKVYCCGWLQNGKLIRPAKVAVAK